MNYPTPKSLNESSIKYPQKLSEFFETGTFYSFLNFIIYWQNRVQKI